MNKFIVQAKETGERLDKFLARKFPQYSRAYLQKQIQKGGVQINAHSEKSNYKLKAGDKIVVAIKPPEAISLAPEKDIPLEIIYEDRDLIVINKPAGIVVHAGGKNLKHTLVNALIAHYTLLGQVGDEPNVRPGIVHRLDKDVSGLMVVAKNNQSFAYLKNLFKTRQIKKIYACLSWGKFQEEKGEIRLPIASNPKNPSRMVAVQNPRDPLNQKAKSACTEFKILKQFDKTALIKVYLKTGRRHQIRVHFKSIGHPLVNDRLYGYRRQIFLGSGRIFLHATQLEFVLPQGKEMKFISPLPEDLEKILNLESGIMNQE